MVVHEGAVLDQQMGAVAAEDDATAGRTRTGAGEIFMAITSGRNGGMFSFHGGR
jgi:hypothetical protein